jgi:peptidoglycan/LPS O-acetylase OafA/YrhL
VFSEKTVNVFLGLIAAVLLINIFIPGLRTIFLVKTESRFGIEQYQDHINMLLALLTIPFLTRNITQKITDSHDGTWSSMSFVIYLVHWPLLRLYNTANILQNDSHKLLNLILLYAASLLFSYIIAIKYDKYFEGVRRKWLKKQEKAKAPVASFA